MEKLIVSNDTFFEEVIALLREGKKVTVPAKGESMLPFIVGGVDSVVLEGVDGGSPTGTVLRTANVGDVVLFRADGRFILHRIIYKDNDKALCEIQGDGILRAKDLCGCDQIYGRVTTVLKGCVTPRGCGFSVISPESLALDEHRACPEDPSLGLETLLHEDVGRRLLGV